MLGKKKSTKDWRDAVCRVGSAVDKGRYGTAFVFGREGDRSLLLTCRHVLDAVGDAERAWVRPWRSRKGGEALPFEVLAQGQGALDLAVIAVEGLVEAPVLELLMEAEPGMACEMYGAGAKDRTKGADPMARRLCGRLGEDCHLSTPQGAGIPSWELLIDQPDEFARLKQGYSGAPVWNPEAEGVAAIVSDRWGDDKGYAFAAENVLEIYPAARRFFSSQDHQRGEYQNLPLHWVFDTLDHDRQISAVSKAFAGPDGPDRAVFLFEAGAGDMHKTLARHLYLELCDGALQRHRAEHELIGAPVIECTVRPKGDDALAGALHAALSADGHAPHTPACTPEELLLDRMRGQPLTVLHCTLMDHGNPIGNREVLKHGIDWVRTLELPGNCRLAVFFCCLGERAFWRTWMRRVLLRGVGPCCVLPRLDTISREQVEFWLDSPYFRVLQGLFDEATVRNALYELIPERGRQSYCKVHEKLGKILS